MPENIFVDTSAFIAIKCKSDQSNEKALSFYDSIISDKKYYLITSNFIIHETVTMLKARLGSKYAVDLSKALRKSNFIKIVKISDMIEDKAWDIFDKYIDKDFSFIDCSSFAFMREYDITKAFTFDRHFTQFGFEIVPM